MRRLSLTREGSDTELVYPLMVKAEARPHNIDEGHENSAVHINSHITQAVLEKKDKLGEYQVRGETDFMGEYEKV